MREIKFRCWYDLDKQMIYNSCPCKNYSAFYMQFTGLKDKNGKEIYQSDLLKKDNFDGVWEVIWSYDSPGYFITNGKIRMPMSKLCQPLVEIIGNTYETKMG